ncbi:MAG: hypothetical protein H0W61_05890 [Bacteroidetes bacterium]|nr:hypothetical protein [Bacteroidota bacterium]
MSKLIVVLFTTVILVCSWTKLAFAATSSDEKNTAAPDKSQGLPHYIIRKTKIKQIEKKDNIVLKDGKKIEGKSTELHVTEIKYLDRKGKMPVKIVSIKRL